MIKNVDFIWDLRENKEMGPLIVAGILGNEQILAKLLDIDTEGQQINLDYNEKRKGF